jgi:hypothetical protein
MPNPTDTQTWTIAKALFGWRPATEEERIVMNGPWPPHIKAATWKDGQMWVGPEALPDFADEVKQHYWIRRMEDRLAEMGLIFQYARLLHLMIPADNRGDIAVDALRATTTQSLAAAVRVVEEAGL